MNLFKKKSRFTTLLWFIGLLAVACAPATGGEPAAGEDPAATVAETGDEPAVPPAETSSSDPTRELTRQEDTRPTGLRLATSSWETDWELRTIDLDELLSGGPPRDGIPSIDNPEFIDFTAADDWLAGNEPVISLEIDGEARAYPLQVMTWHEIANDTIGGVPVAVTFCPLCNSAIVFDRRLDGQTFAFGTSGLLRNSDLVMYDRTTETLWQQFTGEAIVGELAGRQLDFLPSSLISYDNFKDAHPDGVVLSRDTGFSRNYGANPYAGYDRIGSSPFLFDGPVDGRLSAVERVVTVHLDEADIDIAYPLSILSEMGVIHDSRGGVDLVVFHLPGTASALDTASIAQGRDVGATGVFSPLVDGQKLTFTREGEFFVDAQSGTRWNIVGEAVEGELAGAELDQFVSADHFWFSWAAFRPETIVYTGDGETGS